MLALPVGVELVGKRLRIMNRQDFRDLSWLKARIEVAVDGDVRMRGLVLAAALLSCPASCRRRGRAAEAGAGVRRGRGVRAHG